MTKIKCILSLDGQYSINKALSERLLLKPTTFWEMGDEIPPQGRRLNKEFRTRSSSYWSVDTGFIETLHLDSALNQLMEIVRSEKTELIRHIKNNEVEVMINVVIKISNEHLPSICLDKVFLEFCRELNAEIDIDIYIE